MLVDRFFHLVTHISGHLILSVPSLSLYFFSIFWFISDFLGKSDRPLDTILHDDVSYCHHNITVSFLTYKSTYQLTYTEKRKTTGSGVQRSLENFGSSEWSLLRITFLGPRIWS
jgi:hypothetical protein